VLSAAAHRAVRRWSRLQSRVVRQAPRERNYHVFYYLVKGADPEERTRCFLQNKRCEDFYYLNQSGCTSIENWHDDKCFVELKVRVPAVANLNRV